MGILTWIQTRLSQRGKALALYRSGMRKAGKGDFQGAIADYTTVIESLEAPDDLKAMTIYNRALAYSATHAADRAADDLNKVLKMPGLSQDIKTAALRRKERIRKREERGQPSEE